VQFSSTCLAAALLIGTFIGGVQQPPAPEREPFLRVAGEAEVSAEPDRAVVTLGVTAQAPEARAAQEQVNQSMQRVVAAVVAADVPAGQIQTVGLALHPVYSHPTPGPRGEHREPRIVGFRASNTVRVQVEDPGLLGRVIDAGLGAGANQLQGISFVLADDTLQRAEALSRAVQSGRAKAEALASAAGVELLGLQRVEEVETGSFEPMHRMADFAMEADTPVQPGQVRVRARVLLSYRIAPPPR
jgi:uncharacterized protein